jgi:hypothetical protein
MADPAHGGLPFELDKPFDFEQLDRSIRERSGDLNPFLDALTSATAAERDAVVAALAARAAATANAEFAARLVQLANAIIARQPIVTQRVWEADP